MKLNKWFSYILALLLIGAVFYFSKNQWQYFAKIKEISWQGVFWISLAFILAQVAQSIQLKWYIEVFDIHLSYIEAFGLISLQAFGNYLPLSGGVISNITYLKAKKKLPVSKYMSYLLGDTILKFFIYSVLGLILLLCGSFIFGLFEINFLIIGFLIFLFFSAVVCIFSPNINSGTQNKILLWLLHMHKGWDLIRRNKSLIFKNAILHIAIFVLIALQFYVIFGEMGIEVSFPAVLILTVVTNIIKISSLFPGNLGLRETVSGGITKIFSLSFEAGFTASLFTRVITMVWISLFGIYFSFSLIRNFRK
ncbi:hypothetical protein COY07_05600 [Candidatus Peregrinibacteria bacterium CG_4_10_14_0_2_um_filter_43_11]|nr:MAG: hypothetical protein COY07_05600 [Candidatus Peregrinibacteria bacterium CG_4_10_14_0_2_um_filter_43_11]